MAPRAAVRLLVQPVRGAISGQFAPAARYPYYRGPTSDWLETSITRRSTYASSSSGHLVSICLRCSLHATVRSYSTTTNTPKTTNSEVDEGDQLSKNSNNPADTTTSFSPSASAESSTLSSDGSNNNDSPNPSQQAAQLSATGELPSQTEGKRHPLSAQFSTFMDELQTRVLVAGRRINDLTGYSAIDAIKAENAALERAQQAAQARLRAARVAYKSRTERRAATQREVTTLLARKDSWAPPDLERFTTLYRQDHELEAGVAAAAEELTEAEAEEGKLGAALNAGILKRYHEEQIWSDRIRRQSTWGTWGLMGVNILLFLVLQFVAEPWKRGRLMRGVAEREKLMLDEMRHELGDMRAALEASVIGHGHTHARDTQGGGGAAAQDESVVVPEALVASASGEATAAEGTDSGVMTPPESLELASSSSSSWRETLSHPDRWRAAMVDLYSERRIDLRMRDASLLALESAVTGAAVAAGVAVMLLRKT